MQQPADNTGYSNLFNVEISSLDPGESHTVTSSTWSPIARGFIVHFAKECGIHCYKLTSVFWFWQECHKLG